MADEWACSDCGHTTPVDPGNEKCPECGGKLVNIKDIDKDSVENPKYDQDEMEVPLEPDLDLLVDDEELTEDALKQKDRKSTLDDEE